MADEFNRPDWWEESRLFNEMMKRRRTQEQRDQRGEIPMKHLTWSMLAGGSGPGMNGPLEDYIITGYDRRHAPWDEPLFFDEGNTELWPSVAVRQDTGETREGYTRYTPRRRDYGRFTALGKELHSGYDGPRALFLHNVAEENKLHNMFGDLVDQRNQWNDETAKRLFLERRPQEDWDNIREYTLDNFGRVLDINSPAYYSASDEAVVVPKKEPGGASSAGWNRGVIAQHEYEHKDQHKKGFNPRRHAESEEIAMISSAALETPATIGDIINTAAIRRAQGDPVDVRVAPVEFPGGTFDADMMAQWAYSHGYNQPGGPTLTELIYGTPEGRKWLKVIAGPGEPYPEETDIPARAEQLYPPQKKNEGPGYSWGIERRPPWRPIK